MLQQASNSVGYPVPADQHDGPQANIQHTFADLLKQRDAIEAQIKATREAEKARLAAKWHSEATAHGLSVAEILDISHGNLGQTTSPTVTGKTPRRAEKGPPSQSGWTRGTLYAQEGGIGVWIGGTKGRQPGWLREFIAGGRSWESLAVNPT